MVISSKGSGTSSSSASCFGFSQSGGGRTYVDNYFNRGLGRVGMPLGSRVVPSRENSSYPLHDSNICLPSSYSEQTYKYNQGLIGVSRSEACPMTEFRKDRSTFSSAASRESSASSHKVRDNVDSPLNRNCKRIDMHFGSKPVSKPTSRSSSSPKTSVDNEYNRTLGKKGVKHDSMVVSKDSGTASFKETKQYTDNSKSKSSSSTGMKHYVDNSTSRSLRRVGLPDGANAEEVRPYKDNLSNRRLGRASQPTGVAVQSNSGSLEPKFYVNNAHNRRLGRVGYPLGSRPYGVDSEEVVYKDNLSNLVLERAELPRGTAVQSKSRNLKLKVYADNSKNRRLGRVSYPLGCKPEGSFTGSKRTYCDNYLNRQLGRVGKELGTEPMICRKKMEWLHKAYQQCRENPVRTIYIINFCQHKNFSILISNLVCCIILFY